MKLDSFILWLVAGAAALYFAALAIGLIVASPWGFLGVIPLAVFVAVLGVVIRQKLDNKEDAYYEKNIDK